MYRNKDKLSIKQWQEDKKGKHEHKDKETGMQTLKQTHKEPEENEVTIKKSIFKMKNGKNAIKKTLLMIPGVYNVCMALLNI